LEDAVEESHAASVVPLEDDILQNMDLALDLVKLLLEGDESVSIVLLPPHDWADQSLKHPPHVVLVLVKVQFAIVFNVDLELLGVDHIVKTHELLRLLQFSLLLLLFFVFVLSDRVLLALL